MKKVILSFLLAALIIIQAVPVFAVTPTYKPPKIPKIELSEESKDVIRKAVEDYMKDFDFNFEIKLLDVPNITECKYYHSKAFWYPERLQIRWSAVPDATSYEVKIIKPDGTEKIYTETTTTLCVNKGDDEFLSSCVKQKIDGKWRTGTVSIRAVKNDGELYSMWSQPQNISCNSLH